MCPRGCQDKKIKFGARCQGCNENFLYSVLKRIRSDSDLFGSDDEPSEFWNCNKC